jgi:TPP-dependent indolepyruvate ferredoxin oxidoreductase alpha subunit
VKPEQVAKFLTGNEMVAEAAKAIQFHFMGYYPITPSTEIAQLIDAMKAKGEVSTVLLPADGEHGAAGSSVTTFFLIIFQTQITQMTRISNIPICVICVIRV